MTVRYSRNQFYNTGPSGKLFRISGKMTVGTEKLSLSKYFHFKRFASPIVYNMTISLYYSHMTVMQSPYYGHMTLLQSYYQNQSFITMTCVLTVI